MPLFDDESNKLIRYCMKMWGHLDDCFIRISELLDYRFTPKQISIHWKNYLDPNCGSENKSTNFWSSRRKSHSIKVIPVDKRQEEPPKQNKIIYPYYGLFNNHIHTHIVYSNYSSLSNFSHAEISYHYNNNS